MPYLAPEAAIPITSCAPRLAERKARPVIQVARLRPGEEEVTLVDGACWSASAPTPMPMTKTK
jgi:hypothetical protein